MMCQGGQSCFLLLCSERYTQKVEVRMILLIVICVSATLLWYIGVGIVTETNLFR